MGFVLRHCELRQGVYRLIIEIKDRINADINPTINAATCQTEPLLRAGEPAKGCNLVDMSADFVGRSCHQQSCVSVCCFM